LSPLFVVLCHFSIALGGQSAERQRDVNMAPSVVAADVESVAIGTPTVLTAEFSDPDSSDSLTTTVTGLPPWLISVHGARSNGRSQIRAYGIPGDVVRPGSEYRVVWKVSDGDLAESTVTEIHVVEGPSTRDLEQRVGRFLMLQRGYGMPRGEARKLGTRSLPLLVLALRDDQHKATWLNATAAMAFIGDTSYFDTLRAFVWDRFSGPIDEDTFRAIRYAQCDLNVMATMSQRVLDYLEATSDPAVWAVIPWTSFGRSPEQVAHVMALESIIALGYTDSDRARKVLLRLSKGQNDLSRGQNIQGALRTLDAVRAEGFVSVWLRQDDHEYRGPWR
jgi:hypothetical protein